jgi:hypothetical protein
MAARPAARRAAGAAAIPPTVILSDMTAYPRPPWFRVLLTPVLDLVRPSAAAALLATASRPTLVLSFLLGLIVYAAVLVFLGLWAGTLAEVWLAAPATSARTAATASGDPDMPPAVNPGSTEIRARTFGEVWGDWHATMPNGWFGPAETILLLVLLLGPLLVLLLAWLSLPFVHGTGSAWRSYMRAYRAVAGVIAPLTWLTLACGALFIALDHAILEGRLSAAFPFVEENVLFVTAGISVTLLVLWLGRAARGVSADSDQLSLPPRCEGCGYDLTHQPAEGRCPECGLALGASLNERVSRPGCAWAGGKTARSWLISGLAVLFRPRAFYRRLKLRTPAGADAGFAAWHFLAIASGALVWTAVMLAVLSKMRGPPPPGVFPRILIRACGVVVWGTLGCWLGHRVIAASVVTWWLLRGGLPDGRWAAKIVAYEAAFLWVFCAYWGLLVTSLAVLNSWVSRLMGFSRWSGRGEVLALFLGTLGLGVLWVIRYGIAYRAVRWSNF